jgi:hypothetical protein
MLQSRAAVDIRLCVAMIHSELAGYQGYPNTESGVERFARALQECSVSVEHARATLAKFTQKFPTVQEITDTALNLVSQFAIQHNQLLEWEREYGKPLPLKPDVSLIGQEQGTVMWAKIKQHLTLKHNGSFPGFAKISWREIYETMEALGYPLTREIERWYLGR